MKESKRSGWREGLCAGVLAAVVALCMTPASAPAAQVTGRMCAAGGAPMAYGAVLFFLAGSDAPPPRPERYFRMPDVTAPLDGEGRFLVHLREGSYYVGAMRRSGENRPGPLGDRDLFFTVDGGDGSPLVMDIPAEGYLDIGRHAGGRELATVIAERSGRTMTARGPAAPASGAPAWPASGLRGTVRDIHGAPVPGVWVWARFAAPDAPSRQDAYISIQKTAGDGAFSLALPSGGVYQLAVSSPGAGHYLVEPAPGGEYLLTSSLPITVDEGRTLEDVELTVR